MESQSPEIHAIKENPELLQRRFLRVVNNIMPSNNQYWKDFLKKINLEFPKFITKMHYHMESEG